MGFRFRKTVRLAVEMRGTVLEPLTKGLQLTYTQLTSRSVDFQ